jgi:hypothetical protein
MEGEKKVGTGLICSSDAGRVVHPGNEVVKDKLKQVANFLNLVTNFLRNFLFV